MGGKNSKLKFILPLIPECYYYVEPYCGSAAIALNRKPSIAETINDINGDIVNFFRQLRDNGDRLIEKLELTPYSETDYKLATKLEEITNDLERARLFFVAMTMGFGSRLPQTLPGWSFPKKKSESRVTRLLNKVDNLPYVVDRLKHMHISNRPAIKLIRETDTPNTLYYCDPPYVHQTRAKSTQKSFYRYEMTNKEHEELVDTLLQCKGRVALSGYSSILYNKIFEDNGWYRHEQTVTSTLRTHQVGHLPRQEVLWTNYKAGNVNYHKTQYQP